MWTAADRGNHYIPSGWMGDYGDIKLDEGWKENPQAGKSCTKFSYSAQGKQGANWAGVFWQNPANNWGEKKGGFDVRGAKKLTFWARGEKGEERIMEFKVGGISGSYPDSDSASIGPIDLTAEWQQFTIDLVDRICRTLTAGFAGRPTRIPIPMAARSILTISALSNKAAVFVA